MANNHGKASRSAQKIFNNSLLYTLGTLASKAVGFFLIPIYTYHMSSEEYGIATTVIAFVAAFSIVASLSLNAALIRFYQDYTDDEKKRFVGTIVIGVIMNSVLFCFLLGLTAPLYADLLLKDIAFFPYILLGILSLMFEGIYTIYQSLLQAKQAGSRYSLNSIIYLFFHAVTVVLFVVVFKMGALGMILSNFATNVCFAVYGVFSMLKKGYMILTFDTGLFKKSIRYSLPILPHNLSNNLNTYAVKVIINSFLSYALSGIFSIAMQFSTMINLVQSSVNLAFRPWFIEQMKCGEEGRREIRHMTCMIMALYSFCAVMISLVSRELIYFFAEESYFEGWRFVPLLIVAQLISFVYYSHVQTLMYHVGISKFTSICSLSGLLTNIAVSLLLVKPLGVIGIVVGQVAAKTVMSALTVYMSRKVEERVDFGLSKMIVFIVCAAIICLGGILLSEMMKEHMFISIIGRVALAVIAFLIFILGYLPDYIMLFGAIFKKRRLK